MGLVISRVGDVDQYLTHKENVWLLNPKKNVVELVNAVSYLQANSKIANIIGIAGMEAANKKFGFIQYSEKLKIFINSLSKNN